MWLNYYVFRKGVDEKLKNCGLMDGDWKQQYFNYKSRNFDLFSLPESLIPDCLSRICEERYRKKSFFCSKATMFSSMFAQTLAIRRKWIPSLQQFFFLSELADEAEQSQERKPPCLVTTTAPSHSKSDTSRTEVTMKRSIPTSSMVSWVWHWKNPSCELQVQNHSHSEKMDIQLSSLSINRIKFIFSITTSPLCLRISPNRRRLTPWYAFQQLT